MYSPQEIIDDLNKSVEGISDDDLRFFPLKEMKEKLQLMVENSSQCESCKMLLRQTPEVFPLIKGAIASPGNDRKRVDTFLLDLRKHQKSEHGFLDKDHYKKRYSLLGYVVVTLLALSVTIFWGWPDKGIISLSIGCIGFGGGYIVGVKKDRKRLIQQKEWKSEK